MHNDGATLKKIDDLDFVVVDTETTGGKATYNRIIDIAAFHFKGGQIVDKFQSLINPGRPIPIWITMLTGIDDDMVKHAPKFDEIAKPLLEFLDRGVFVAHNAPFDYSFVQEEFRRLDIPFLRPQLCTLKLARILFPELPSRSLGSLCEHMWIDIWDRHRAHGDAEATVYVLKNILKKVSGDYGLTHWDDLEAFAFAGPLDLPKALPFSVFAKLPQAPARYIFKDAGGNAMAQGSAKNIRNRIKTYFVRSNQSEKSNRLRKFVHALEIEHLPLELG